MRPGTIILSGLLLITMGCSRNVPATAVLKSSHVEGRLQKFFAMCERDTYNAVKVIADRELIKNLTHLHRMNAGGKKYYLLERENITEMIKSVTEGVYSDYILINHHGIVIYTRENDDLFGKKVTTTLIASPLDHCFEMSGSPIYIEDVSAFPDGNGHYNLFISGGVNRDGSSHGILILQVNTEKIEGILETGTMIIDHNGINRITGNRPDMLGPYRYYGQMNIKGIESGKIRGFNAGSEYFNVRPFNYKNLKWIIIEKS